MATINGHYCVKIQLLGGKATYFFGKLLLQIQKCHLKRHTGYNLFTLQFKVQFPTAFIHSFL